MTRFTPRMARFVAEYRKDPNGGQAAIRAGYSPRNPMEIAYKLLRKPAVKAALAAAERRTFDEIDIKALRVLAEAARVAFADLRRLFDGEGRPKAVADIDADTLAAVAIVETVDRAGRPVRRLRGRRKLAALTLLARHVLLFHGRATPGGESLADALARHRAAARARLEALPERAAGQTPPSRAAGQTPPSRAAGQTPSSFHQGAET